MGIVPKITQKSQRIYRSLQKSLEIGGLVLKGYLGFGKPNRVENANRRNYLMYNSQKLPKFSIALSRPRKKFENFKIKNR